jgi:hypothetical protein
MLLRLHSWINFHKKIFWLELEIFKLKLVKVGQHFLELVKFRRIIVKSNYNKFAGKIAQQLSEQKNMFLTYFFVMFTVITQLLQLSFALSSYHCLLTQHNLFLFKICSFRLFFCIDCYHILGKFHKKLRP